MGSFCCVLDLKYLKIYTSFPPVLSLAAERISPAAEPERGSVPWPGKWGKEWSQKICNFRAEISMDLEYSGSGSYNYLFLKQLLILLKVVLISLSLHVLGIEGKPMVSVNCN